MPQERKLRAQGRGPGPGPGRGCQRGREKLRNSWHSPGSWVSCPKRQKHLIIQHSRNEGVTAPSDPSPPLCSSREPTTHSRGHSCGPPGSSFQVSFGDRLLTASVGKGEA